MSDRLTAAVLELVAALREDIAAESKPARPEPERLMSIEEASRALGIGRTATYAQIGAGQLRSITIGRRRLVPASAVAELCGSAMTNVPVLPPAVEPGADAASGAELQAGRR